MPDWKKIKAEYIQGTSYRKLAEKYGVPSGSILRRMTKEKWTDLRKQKNAKCSAKIVDTIADQEARRAVTLCDTADALIRKIAEQVAQADIIPAQDAGAYMMAIRRYKEICDIRSREDIEEQRARIEKLKKDASPDQADSTVTITFAGDTGDYAN